MGPKQGIPELAAARLQRWALILAAYNDKIEFRPTQEHGNMDGLSEVTHSDPEVTHSDPEVTHCDPEVTHTDPDINMLNVSQIEALLVLADQVQSDMLRDPLLSKVIQ